MNVLSNSSAERFLSDRSVCFCLFAESRLLVSQEKRQYEPVDTSKQKQKDFRNRILARVSKKNPKCLSALMYKATLDVNTEVPVSCNSLPSATFLEDYIVAKTRDLTCSTKEKCDYMLSNLPSISTDDIHAVADATVAQSANEIWQRARVGRITASNFGRVKTKMTTLSQRDDVDAIALLKTLMIYDPVNSNLPALVYGRNMEKEACKKYQQFLGSKGHVGVKVNLCGLVLSPKHVFLGASPDLVVECQCCGKGLAEIKCPHSFKDSDLSDERPPCLDQNYQLKPSHAYYAQVQGQMAIVGLEWCDFVVYTSKRVIVQRIGFDQTFWNDLEERLVTFFRDYLLLEIVTHANRPAQQVATMKETYKRQNYLAQKMNDPINSQESDAAIMNVACFVDICEDN